MRAMMRVVGVCLLIGAMNVALICLLMLMFWGLFNGHIWLGIGAFAAMVIWYRFAMLKRNPANPDDFKDFGV